MSLHEPQFRFVLDIRLAQHQPRMPLGRRILALAGQIEQPHKLASLPVLLLLFRPDPRPADDGRQFSGNSCEYARWGQYTEMRDAERAIWMLGV